MEFTNKKLGSFTGLVINGLLLDKRIKKSYTGLHIFEDGGDAGDEYNYSYPREDQIYTSENRKSNCSLIESGPLRACLKIEFQLKLPKALNKKRVKGLQRNP